MTHNLQHQRGFSLLELMSVLVIFGLLLGFGIPQYQHYALTQKLRGTSENLVQTIQLQRSRAMATGQNVTLNFNTAAPAGWTVLSGGRQNQMTLPRDITYASANPTSLIIDRFGRMNASGLVVFQNRTGALDTVSVELSGLALIR